METKVDEILQVVKLGSIVIRVLNCERLLNNNWQILFADVRYIT